MLEVEDAAKNSADFEVTYKEFEVCMHLSDKCAHSPPRVSLPFLQWQIYLTGFESNLWKHSLTGRVTCRLFSPLYIVIRQVNSLPLLIKESKTQLTSRTV